MLKEEVRDFHLDPRLSRLGSFSLCSTNIDNNCNKFVKINYGQYYVFMNTLQYIVIFSLIGGLFSLIGGVLLLRSKKSAEKLVKYATPFAGGALLAAVFLDLLKEGIEIASAEQVLLAALIGIIIFFLAEGFLHWFHHHHVHKGEKDPKTSLIIFGDTLHNGLDGVAIASAFLISVPTGIVTTMAVAAHEIPQEIGDFGLLLSKGMKKSKVLFYNAISALATLVFAVITYWVGSQEALPLGVLLGLSAGFLLYIATSDVIPTIHANRKNKRAFDLQALMLILGVVVVGLITSISHQHIDAGHDHETDNHHDSNCIVYLNKEGNEVINEDCHGHSEEDHHED